MKTISKGKRIKEASNDRYEVFFNENYACRMRGTDSDRPSQTAEFNSVQELLDFFDDEGIIYLEDEEYWADIYEANTLSDDVMDDLIEKCNEVDISGGDIVVFSIIHMRGNTVISERTTQWDPRDWAFDDDEYDYDDLD